jgi:hypothetical protein
MSTERRNSNSTLKNESGAALVLSLVVLISLAAMVPAALMLTQADMSRTNNYQEDKNAFYVADAGYEHAKDFIGKSGLFFDTLLPGANGTSDGGGTDDGLFTGMGAVVTHDPGDGNHLYNQVTMNDANGNAVGTYMVRMYDNDEPDGDLYTDTDFSVWIESIGTTTDINGDPTTKTIKALTYRFQIDPIMFPAGITTVGDHSFLSFSGSSEVSGGDGTNGYAMDGTIDASCDGVPAVASESGSPVYDSTSDCGADPTLETCILLNGGPTITGDTVAGDITGTSYENGQTDFTSEDAEDLWQTLTEDANGDGIADMADNQFNGSITIAGNASGGILGTLADPTILYVKGDVTVTTAGGPPSTQAEGYGILVVDGSLKLDGRLEWNGLVLVGGCPNCNGSVSGNGKFTIYGAILVGGDPSKVAMAGGFNAYYSCEAVMLAQSTNTNNLTTVHWYEVNK